MVVRELLVTAEAFFDYAALPENERRDLELRQGVIVEMPSASPLHGWIVMLFIQVVTRFLDLHPVAYIFGDSNDFVLSPGLVYKPDASVILKERLPSVPGRFHMAPDIAVEVISPSNSAAEISEKVENYLHHGSQMVILIYTDPRAVRVCVANDDGTITLRPLTAEDWLDCGAVLPGFRVQVKALFPDLPVETA
ncbi:MAG: Uma2 family endonuclease [Anaerolineae bacterium]|nr:Uma2 family endonuclease [Anaerolineae bacterium]NUQ06681.1 Uma2 family endonuclease [Anaerolineae bacterium]